MCIDGPSRVTENIKERNYLVVEEKISDSLVAIAVFDTNERSKSYNYRPVISKGITREIPFIYLDNLYLVQPKTGDALDLAAPWYDLPPDTKDSFIKTTHRRIGFMTKDANNTDAEVLEAFVRTNTILLTDTQNDVSWKMTEALAEEKTPVLNKWIAATLAGANSTQKFRDLVRNEKGEIESLSQALASFLANTLRGRAPGSTIRDESQPVRFPQIFCQLLFKPKQVNRWIQE